MKILLLMEPVFAPGNWKTALSDRGHTVHWCSSSRQQGVDSSIESFAANTINRLAGRFKDLHLQKSALLLQSLAFRLSRLRVRRLIRKEKPCLILFLVDQGHKVYRLCHEEVVCSRIPVVFGIHNHQLLVGAREKLCFENAQALIFLNEESRNFYEECFSISEKPWFKIPSLFLPKSEKFDLRRHSSMLSLGGGEASDRPHLVASMGGKFVTATVCPFSGRRLRNPSRYDFIDVATMLAAIGIEVSIYGEPKIVERPLGPPMLSQQVRSFYEEISGENIALRGVYSDFERKLSESDFFICKGFLPGERLTSEFENMNYQLRYSSSLIAGVPVLVAEGTDLMLERQVKDHGFGAIWHIGEDLESAVERLPRKGCEAFFDRWNSAARMNSIDSYMDDFERFLDSISEPCSRSIEDNF